MKPLIIFTTCFIIFVVLFLPALLGLGIRFYPVGTQPNWSQVEDIEGYSIVSQQFTSQEDRILGIALSLKNPSLRNKKDIILTLEDENKVSVRTSTLNGSYIQDGAYIKFLFSPVVDSKDKKYNFTLSAPQANKDEALEVGTTNNKQSWVDNLTVREEKIEGRGAAFVTLHKPVNILTPILDIYEGWLGRLTADGWFFAFYLIAVLVLLGYLTFGSIRKVNE